jgi:hypothetical protein
MIAGLKAIQDRLGKDQFPLINQYYYSHYTNMGFIPGEYPQVTSYYIRFGLYYFSYCDWLRFFRFVFVCLFSFLSCLTRLKLFFPLSSIWLTARW